MELEYYKNIINKRLKERDFLFKKTLQIEKKPDFLHIQSLILYSEIGMLNLNLDRNATFQAKQEFFKLLRASEFEIWYETGLYPDLIGNRNPYFKCVSTLSGSIADLFLCDHEEALKYVFNYSFEYEKDRKVKSKFDFIIQSFLFLMIVEKEKAKLILKEEYKRSDEYIRSLANVVGGILYDDLKLINKGINYQINYGTGEHGPEANYHHKATGLAKIALRFGMEPDLSDSRINKKLLEHEKVDYVDIDNLFEALGVEPIMRHSLRNY